jgi:hypothetical protein
MRIRLELTDTELRILSGALASQVRIEGDPEAAKRAGIVPPCWEPLYPIHAVVALQQRILAICNFKLPRS